MRPVSALSHPGFWIAGFSTLIVSTLAWIGQIPRLKSFIVKEMMIIGIDSILLVLAASMFIGGETVLQTELQFSGLVPMRYLGMAVFKALSLELCPVIVSLIVSSRISTSIAAEIGTIKESEQLAAMECLDLDPYRYIILPKLVACIVMVPTLVILGTVIGLMASVIIAMMFIDVTLYSYIQGFRIFFDFFGIFVALLKSIFFGAIICFVGAYSGYKTKGGALGVGTATTNAVVVTAILVLITDFSIGYAVQ